MSKESEVVDGTKAHWVLQDPAFLKAFEDVEDAIVERWKAAPIRDTQGAHELKLMQKLLTDVRSSLELAVQNGKLAAAELKLSKEKPPKWWALNRG